MKPIDSGKFSVRLILVIAAFFAVQTGGRFFESFFEEWDAAIVDRLAALAPQSPTFDAPSDVVFVDANFYYDRSYHARVIERLKALNVSAQVIDFVFTDKVDANKDRLLIQAARAAGNIFFGLSFGDLQKTSPQTRDALDLNAAEYLDRSKWRIVENSHGEDFYVGVTPRVTFPELAAVSSGLGFLNLTADRDGFLRRSPLLVRYRGAFLPSLAFRVVCDHLKVSPESIQIEPGNSIRLRGVKTDGSEEDRDIVIPIDENGNLIINYNVAWRKFKHFSYRELFQENDDPVGLSQLRDALAGKIVIISENVVRPFKAWPPGQDSRLSSGVAHAVVIQDILSEKFLRILPGRVMTVVEIFLAAAILAVSIFFSSLGLFVGALCVVALYLSGAYYLFFSSNFILQFVSPLLMVGLSTAMIMVAVGVERAFLFAKTEKAKRIAENELDIGRRIQSGFFPSSLPSEKDWEIAVHFQAAHHVAGDFYDAFYIGEEKHLGVVVADVCDKGVGAALYMALFRSLIRILSGAVDGGRPRKPRTDAPKILHDTILSINDYIATTHGQDSMFATIFFGILNPTTGEMVYINGGHEPPIIVGQNGVIKAVLNPSGPAVGAYAAVEFTAERAVLEPGDIFFSYTDGIADACNAEGKPFTRERLIHLASVAPRRPKRLIEAIKKEFGSFTQENEPFDDITLMAVGRCDVRNEFA